MPEKQSRISYNQGKLMSEEETRKYTEKWGVHKGIVTYYLIAECLHGKQNANKSCFPQEKKND